jgi:hypothetical protein
MSNQTPATEQSAAFEEAIAYLDSLPPGELERRIACQRHGKTDQLTARES